MATPPKKGRDRIRQALQRVFLKQSQHTTPEPSAMPEDTDLRPCPQCGAWQWRLGLLDAQCTSCGYRNRPTSKSFQNLSEPCRG